MRTTLPSPSKLSPEQFFTFDQVKEVATSLHQNTPVIQGKVWAGEERTQGWTVECHSFTEFKSSLQHIADRIEFMAYDESYLDDDMLHIIQDDVYRYVEDEGLSHELAAKALSALRSHEGELFAVMAYAFLKSGQVIFVRSQNELAKYVYHPDRLLSSEGIQRVRKLRTLAES